MADVFVSYARQDRRLVLPVVTALEAEGWSVWWDPEITPGQEFDELIAAELDAAGVVVVVWRPASTVSRWVKGEDHEAADRQILAPIRFDGAKLPIDVRSIHTTDFDDWNGDPQSPAFRELCRAINGRNVQVCTFSAGGAYGGGCVRVDRSLVINMASDCLPLRVGPDGRMHCSSVPAGIEGPEGPADSE